MNPRLRLINKAIKATDKAICRFSKLESAVKVDEPTFKPDPNLGESEPSDDQLKQREDVLKKLAPLLLLLLALLNSNKSTEDKIAEVNEITDELNTELTEVVSKSNTLRNDAGINSMKEAIQNAIDKAKKNIKIPAAPLAGFTALTTQQKTNIDAITNQIRDRTIGQITLNDVMSNYPTNDPKTIKENNKSFVNSILSNAQDRLEHLSIFGWLEAFMIGFIGLGLAANQTKEIKVELPWLTCEDNNNCTGNGPCPDCQANADGGPYPLDQYPVFPAHDLCQCNDPPPEPIITIS